MKKNVMILLLCLTVIVALVVNFYDEKKWIGIICYVMMVILGIVTERIINTSSKK